MIGIYGANGFIGRHLMRRLSAENRLVRAVSRRFDNGIASEYGSNVDWYEADFRQPLDMVASLQGIETVVQLISNSSPGLGNANVIADINDNVVPHAEFLQSCVNAGIRRYIFVSSGGTVYGPDAPVPTPETSPCNPISSHGITKLFVEKYIKMHGHVSGLDFSILRLSNPYGPGQVYKKGQGLIPAILQQHKMGKSVQIFGGGTARRDYIYIDDVIDALVCVIDKTSATQSVLNIGSGISRSVLEVIEAIERVHGIKFRTENVSDRPTDVSESRLDIAEATKVLGWQPNTEFEEGLAKLIQTD